MMKMYRAWNPNVGEILLATVISILGYFSPIKHIANMILAFFILDVIFGYWKSRKIHKKKFSVSIIWNNTVPRMVVAMVLLLCTFILDQETNQNVVQTYKIAGWFIGALLIFSIGENGYHITKWKVLLLFAKVAQKKIKEQTGIEISKEDLIK